MTDANVRTLIEPHAHPSSQRRMVSTVLAVTLVGFALASCGGGGPSTPPLPLLEALIIDPSEIDWASVLAAREVLAESATEFPFSNYGLARPGAMRDPQVSYFVPLGTPVYAPVTGTVLRIETLYSADVGIQIGAPGQDSPVPVWEVEHVIDPLVAVGDSVVAGQRIATASDGLCTINPTYCEQGIAVVELGLLTSAGHECPFAPDRVSPAAASAIDAELDAMYATVRDLGGDPTAFDSSGWETSQCPTLEIVDPM